MFESPRVLSKATGNEQGAGSREQGAGSRQQGREQKEKNFIKFTSMLKLGRQVGLRNS